ncbi:MAG: hypothetical protein ACRENE_21960 [Polyangiaceae bacterium]
MSGEPVRLLEQGDLPLSARLLLDARQDGDPFAYDVELGAMRLRGALAAAAAAVATGASGAGVTKGSLVVGSKGLLAGAVVKTLLAVAAASLLFAGGVVVGTSMATRSAGEAPAPPPAGVGATPGVPLPGPAKPVETSPAAQVAPPLASNTASPPSTGAPAASVASASAAPPRSTADRGASARMPAAPVAAAPAASAPTPAALADPAAAAPLAATPSPPAAVSAPAPSAGTAPPAPSLAAPSAPTQDDSLAELRAIATARNLIDRDPEAALAALDKIGREHPRGYFVEERQALIVIALSQAGHTSEAQTRAAAFLRAHPDGPYSERIRAILHAAP